MNSAVRFVQLSDRMAADARMRRNPQSSKARCVENACMAEAFYPLTGAFEAGVAAGSDSGEEDDRPDSMLTTAYATSLGILAVSLLFLHRYLW